MNQAQYSQEQLTRELICRKASRDFALFCMAVRPGYSLQPFHDTICHALDDMVRGSCDRLILVMPPRHGKSELVSRKFPAYFLGHRPDAHIISTSYGFDLVKTFSRDVRRVMEGEAYNAIFPGTLLDPTSAAVDRWETMQGGAYLAQGVGGSITGHGADLLICDDLISNREQAESAVQLDKVWDFYTGSLYTRLHPGGKIVIIMTRWSPADPVGRILAGEDAEDWRVIHFPALSDTGVALWPDRYPRQELDRIKRNIGGYDFESLYQGRPYARGGRYLKREWLRVIEERDVPEDLAWVRGLDLAVSTKQSADYSASVKVAKHTIDGEQLIYLADGWFAQMDWPAAKKRAIVVAQRERINLCVEAVAGFVVAYRELRDALETTCNVTKITVSKDKLSRALPWIAIAERGGLNIVRWATGNNDWIDAFIAQCESFPSAGAHDDLIDAVSIAYEGASKVPSMV